jgi:DNA mismatch repair protein MutS
VLLEHESAEHELTGQLASDPQMSPALQLTMFTPISQKIADRLRETDLNSVTPLEALNLLHELKKQLS